MPEPKVRFKMDDGSSFPAWNDVVLGDIATRVTRKNTNGETDRPLTIASIEGLVDQRTYFGKTIASKDMSGYFLLKKGEYAYNKSYSAGYDYGSIKRLDKYDMGALSTLYICFALDEDQNTDFYDCYFNGLSWYNQMPQICAEGARNHGLLNVSPNDFFKIQLSVPSSKEEQQKIADFLSSVDEVIAASEKEVANLEMQKKAVMKKIFSQEVRFKKADGSDFPEWEFEQMESVITLLSGQDFPPDQYNDNCIGIPYLTGASCIVNGKTTAVRWTETPKCTVYRGDVVVVCKGSGSGAVAVVNQDEAHIARQFMCIRPENRLEKNYCYHRVCNMTEEIRAEAKGTIPGIDRNTILKRIVGIPCLEEQHLIANFLSDFDEAVAASKKELELWKELKKGLLQQMFV